MIEQLSHDSEFDVSGLSADTSVQAQPLPALDIYDISRLADLSLQGDGVALQVLEVTSTPTTGASEEDAYMLATEEGAGPSCPPVVCGGNTEVGDEC